MVAEHAQDVVGVLLWAIGGLGAMIAGLAGLLWAVGLSSVKGQFAALKAQNASNIASVKADLDEFRRQDEARHHEANEKIDALFDLHRRIEDVMRGELRTLERSVVDVRERVLVIESKCQLFHADDRRDPLKVRGGD